MTTITIHLIEPRLDDRTLRHLTLHTPRRPPPIHWLTGVL